MVSLHALRCVDSAKRMYRKALIALLASLLLLNAVAVLSEDRFLARSTSTNLAKISVRYLEKKD